VVEQPEYHLFHRTRVEQEYAPLYEEIGLGLTTWSPLAGGLLTGKYRSGIPDDSRAAMKGMAAYQQAFIHPERNAAVGRLEGLAAELGCSVTQLAIAWATKNRRVSSVILGASGLGQLQHNLGALDVQARLTKEVLARIDEIALPLAD
jgi:aryl-alcohol dehydrogenase-like predicted oxidoreductase